MAERRRGERFRLSLPVHLKNGTGMTRNISSSGIMFETETLYAVDDVIGLSVDFPDSSIQCDGRVVRVEKVEGQSAVAVEFASYVFI
jgi:hypothetical protein